MATLTTRMLKAECLDCGYVARVTRAHLVRIGTPICPCNKRAMDCPQWDEIIAAEMDQLESEENTYSVLREKWVHLRSMQECSRCHGELPHNEYAHHAVYTLSGEFISEYTCAACHPETRSQYNRLAVGYV